MKAAFGESFHHKWLIYNTVVYFSQTLQVNTLQQITSFKEIKN